MIKFLRKMPHGNYYMDIQDSGVCLIEDKGPDMVKTIATVDKDGWLSIVQNYLDKTAIRAIGAMVEEYQEKRCLQEWKIWPSFDNGYPIVKMVMEGNMIVNLNTNEIQWIDE